MRKRARHDTYDELLPDGQVEYMIDRYQSADVIKHDISQKPDMSIILRLKTKRLSHTAELNPNRKKLFVSKIYVLPEYQRQGIASSLFKTVLENYSDSVIAHFI